MRRNCYFLFFMLLFLSFSATAFNCELTNDVNYCNNITNSDIDEAEKDLLFSSLLYSDYDFPDHEFVKEYNLNINVESAPENTTVKDSSQIKGAWLSFLAVMPSVTENNLVYVTDDFLTLCEYGYSVYVPENYQASYPNTKDDDCRTVYTLTKNEPQLNIYSDNELVGQGKEAEININADSVITARLDIQTDIKEDHYKWHSWCCKSGENGCIKTCHSCKFSNSNVKTDSLTLEESKEVKLYKSKPYAEINVTDSYYGMTKGRIKAGNYSKFSFKSENFSYINQKYSYDLIFDRKPYYIASIRASETSHNKQRNINLANDTFVVKGAPECSLFAYNHFFNNSFDCDLSFEEQNSTKLKGNEENASLDLLLYLLIAGIIIYIFYKLIRSQFRKFTLVLVLLLLVVPLVMAADEPQEDEKKCGITNLASCIPEKIYEFFIYLVNLPMQPLLAFIKTLLTTNVYVDIFKHVWRVVCYILSFFYLFLFLYSGFVFLTSSDNPIKRSRAKDGLRNAVLMIFLVQASFFIYELLISLSGIMNTAILGMIDEHFFMITFDNIFNIGLEFCLFPIYLISLLFAMLLLSLRYIIVSIGVILFPIGIFCYYAPSLRSYGKFILRVLGNFIFITFIDLLVILGCSMIIEDPVFESFKIVVMIICFSIVNYSLFWCFKFAMSRIDTSELKEDVGQAVKYVALAAGA